MTWFATWWEGLSLLQQGFACAALPATAVLLLQTLLLLFGVGGHAADHGDFDQDHDFGHSFDHDHDLDDGHDFGHGHDWDHGHDAHDPNAGPPQHDGAHHASGVRILTVRGLVAFFAVGGWLGIAMVDLGVPAVGTWLIAFVGGLFALLLVAWVLALFLRLQESGNLQPTLAIAKTASVYLSIPPARSGTGKVNLTLQERYVEMDAVTDSDAPIPTGTLVQVVSLAGTDTLVVRPLAEPLAPGIKTKETVEEETNYAN